MVRWSGLRRWHPAEPYPERMQLLSPGLRTARYPGFAPDTPATLYGLHRLPPPLASFAQGTDTTGSGLGNSLCGAHGPGVARGAQPRAE